MGIEQERHGLRQELAPSGSNVGNVRGFKAVYAKYSGMFIASLHDDAEFDLLARGLRLIFRTRKLGALDLG